MLFLAPIVFVGIVGNHHDAVEHQLEPSLEKNGITEMAIPDAERAAIVKHTAASKQIVKGLHASGVIAGQLGGTGKARTFRVVIYDGDGNLTTDLESPIGATGLTKKNIQMFEINISDIVASAPPPTKQARVAKKSAPAAADDESPIGSSHGDDDAPPGMPGAKKSEPVAVAAASDDDSAAAAPAVTEQAAAPSHGHNIHVHIGVLAGIVGRNLAVDPNTVQTYSSSPVGTGGVGGSITIGAHVRVDASFEHTLVMHTAVGADNSSTGIGHAEGALSYQLLNGSVQLAPLLGFGTRYFSIDSMSTMRSPDVEYEYVMLGAAVGKQLNQKWALRGLAAFEPVVGGLAPGATAPSRWGFDVGAAVELKATEHVFARAAFDYQSFGLSWDMKGGATDAYPGGSVTAGASF